MVLKRRDLFKFGAAKAMASSLSFSFPVLAGAEPIIDPPQRKGPSVLQGATDETRTQFSIVYDEAVELDFLVSNSQKEEWRPDTVEVITSPGQLKKITKVYFSQLRLQDNYILTISRIDDRRVLDVRDFKTLDLGSSALRFAICSCMDHKLHQPEIWKNLILQKPQMILFTGDQVYVDRDLPVNGVTPAHLWKKFCDARATLEIYFSKTLIPIIGTWDDHDFGVNDGNSINFPLIKESQNNFLSFMAQKESYCRALIRGPGISSAFKFGPQLFILTDGRSFRKEADSRDRFAHWGEAQEKWMLDLIRNHQGSTWLVNGSQIFPSFLRRESMSAHHPVQFQGLLLELKSMPSKVVFITGDIHYSEISQIESSDIGYKTYELTSSSVHSKGLPVSTGFIFNSRRIASAGERNYIMVDAKAIGRGLQFEATSRSASGHILFQKKLIV